MRSNKQPLQKVNNNIISNINTHNAMTKDIPEIDDLTKGINDTDISLTDEPQDQSGAQESSAQEISLKVENLVPFMDNIDKCWNSFLSHLESSDTRDGRNDRLVCKLDRDLADSLDDCDIHNRCRSDLVNAIVRAFFDVYLPQLARFRREKKSLLANFREE